MYCATTGTFLKKSLDDPNNRLDNTDYFQHGTEKCDGISTFRYNECIKDVSDRTPFCAESADIFVDSHNL